MGRYIMKSYIMRNLAYISMAVLAGCFIIYGIIYKNLSMKLSTSFRGAFFQMKALQEGLDMTVLLAITLYGIVAWTGLLVISLFATHKVAGPLFRLESMVQRARDGHIPAGFVFRDGDQIAPLANVQSEFFGYIGRSEDRLKQLADDAQATGRGLRRLVADEKDGAGVLEDLIRLLTDMASLENGRMQTEE